MLSLSIDKLQRVRSWNIIEEGLNTISTNKSDFEFADLYFKFFKNQFNHKHKFKEYICLYEFLEGLLQSNTRLGAWSNPQLHINTVQQIWKCPSFFSLGLYLSVCILCIFELQMNKSFSSGYCRLLCCIASNINTWWIMWQKMWMVNSIEYVVVVDNIFYNIKLLLEMWRLLNSFKCGNLSGYSICGWICGCGCGWWINHLNI